MSLRLYYGVAGEYGGFRHGNPHATPSIVYGKVFCSIKTIENHAVGNQAVWFSMTLSVEVKHELVGMRTHAKFFYFPSSLVVEPRIY